MFHLIIGWALIALGLIDAGLAILTWFVGAVYLPSQNTAAIVGGIILIAAGVAVLVLL